ARPAESAAPAPSGLKVSLPSARDVPATAPAAAAPVAAALNAGQDAATSAHKPRAARANRAAPSDDKPGDGTLPADWDERLPTTPNSGKAAHPRSAGGLSESDLK